MTPGIALEGETVIAQGSEESIDACIDEEVSFQSWKLTLLDLAADSSSPSFASVMPSAAHNPCRPVVRRSLHPLEIR
jgi:hypothetical protein